MKELSMIKTQKLKDIFVGLRVEGDKLRGELPDKNIKTHDREKHTTDGNQPDKPEAKYKLRNKVSNNDKQKES